MPVSLGIGRSQCRTKTGILDRIILGSLVPIEHYTPVIRGIVVSVNQLGAVRIPPAAIFQERESCVGVWWFHCVPPWH